MSPLATRRLIYGLLLAALSAAVLLQLGFPEQPTARTRRVFDTIEKLPGGSRVMVSLDFDPSSAGELNPMANAMLRHLAEKRHKIYLLTLWDQGAPILDDKVKLLVREYKLVESRDFVNLGFKPGRQVLITNAMADLSKDFPTDARGIHLRDPGMPLTKTLRNFSEMDLLISIGGGSPGPQEWVQYGATARNKKMLAGAPGVQAPQLLPYVPHQLTEVLIAIKGAAEYEELLIRSRPHLTEKDHAGLLEARRRMGPQVVAHVLIVILIVVGNILTLRARAHR